MYVHSYVLNDFQLFLIIRGACLVQKKKPKKLQISRYKPKGEKNSKFLQV